jgi:hypothetical protein
MYKPKGKLAEKKEEHRGLSNVYSYFYLSMLWMVDRLDRFAVSHANGNYHS